MSGSRVYLFLHRHDLIRAGVINLVGKLNSIFKNFSGSLHILKNGIYDRPPRKGWSRGGVVLLGDAAHPTTPNLGQGACMAIEGAYLLAGCMNKYGSIGEAATEYERRHYPRTRKVIRESLINGKVGQLEHPLGLAVRNTIVGALPAKIAAQSLGKYFSYDMTKVV